MHIFTNSTKERLIKRYNYQTSPCVENIECEATILTTDKYQIIDTKAALRGICSSKVTEISLEVLWASS